MECTRNASPDVTVRGRQKGIRAVTSEHAEMDSGDICSQNIQVSKSFLSPLVCKLLKRNPLVSALFKAVDVKALVLSRPFAFLSGYNRCYPATFAFQGPQVVVIYLSFSHKLVLRGKHNSSARAGSRRALAHIGTCSCVEFLCGLTEAALVEDKPEGTIHD
eukprot:5977982-Amphidinium_carterae.3